MANSRESSSLSARTKSIVDTPDSLRYQLAVTSYAGLSRGAPTQRQAVDRLRDLVDAGAFAQMTVVDRHTGELLAPEARALFAALPAVGPASTPEELIDCGLIPSVPSGWRTALETARYRVGRELFVRTTVSHRVRDRLRPVGAFDSQAPLAFTHRALLRGQSGDSFAIELEGAEALLLFPKTDVFAWNEATPMPPGGTTLAGVHIDFTEPLLKAHVCAAYTELGRDIAAIDFSDAEAARSQQARLLHRLASRVRMQYAGRGDGYAGARAGALLLGGQGVCFVQRAVAAALLAPFARLLAFDLQVAFGRTLRLGAPHGFLVVTLRPSLARFVIDPAWGEPLTSVPVAFFGPAWGHDRRLDGFEGGADPRVPPEAADLPELELEVTS